MQPGCGLLYPDGVAEYVARGLRMDTVPVQRISGRGAATVQKNDLYRREGKKMYYILFTLAIFT